MDHNTSGHGAAAVVPPEARRWSWGGFLLNWIWGIGNHTFIALLMFVPFLNLLMPFVLGAKGGEWAWRNRRWESVERFQVVQRRWALWGLAAWIVVLGLMAGSAYMLVSAIRGSDAYRLGVQALEADTQAAAALGKPIEAGFPVGNLSVSGTEGEASFSFAVKGPKAEGRVYMRATRELGKWSIDREELEVDGREDRIVVVGPKGLPI
jgi:hypothetical protein